MMVCYFLLILLNLNKSEKLIYSENFNDLDQLSSEWWHEGTDKVIVENGHLRLDANPDGDGENHHTSTVWLNKKFKGNLKIEYDAHILKSDEVKNNINFFFLYSSNTDSSLYETRHHREDAKYSKYHKLNGYIFTYVANGSSVPARFRLRDNPGFNLLDESFNFESKKGKTYHITIQKIGRHIIYSVNGQEYLNVREDQYNAPHQEGILGFRTYKTDLWLDNFKIYQIHP